MHSKYPPAGRWTMQYIMFTIILILLLIYRSLAGKVIPSFAGPYTIKMSLLEDCPYDGSDTTKDVSFVGIVHHVRAKGNSKFFTGNVIVNQNITKGTHNLHLELAKWDRVAGWKDHYMTLPFGEMCTAFDTFCVDFMKKIASHSTVPERCPIPVGKYPVTNFPIDLESLTNLPLMPYGRYRMDTYLYHAAGRPGAPGVKNKLPVSCVRAVIEINPKTRGN